MIKFFHRLNAKQADRALNRAQKKHQPWSEFAKDFPRPKWCNEPEAVHPLGCWGLMYGNVNKEGWRYCVGCDFRKVKSSPSTPSEHK
jgi:hypothetical protein